METGKANFQVLLGGAWHDFPDDVQMQLIVAFTSGASSVRLHHHGQDYEVFFDTLKQFNLKTGRCRPIRLPLGLGSTNATATLDTSAPMACASCARDPGAICAREGCCKPSWNGAAGEFCSKACRALSPEYALAQQGIVVDAFECPCCMEQVPAATGVRVAPMPKPMGCDHTMCEDCFKRLVSGQIEQKELSVCPMCPETKAASIPSWLVARVLGKRSAMAMAENEQLHLGQADGGKIRLWQCPIPDCNNRQVMPRWWDENKITDKRRRLKCAGCSKTICLRCRMEDHVGVTCAAYRAWQEANDAGEHSYAELIKSGLIKPCPNCSAPILKADGCNFMTCSSCKSPNGMCWETGKPRHGPGGCGGGHNCH